MLEIALERRQHGAKVIALACDCLDASFQLKNARERRFIRVGLAQQRATQGQYFPSVIQEFVPGACQPLIRYFQLILEPFKVLGLLLVFALEVEPQAVASFFGFGLELRDLFRFLLGLVFKPRDLFASPRPPSQVACLLRFLCLAATEEPAWPFPRWLW